MALNVCMVGCGWMAEEGHGPALAQYARAREAVSLAACCDTDGERARSFATRFGFARWYRDMDAMLDAERPGAVVLAVPAALTAELSVRILGRGIPLLTEKPPGASPEQALAIARAAEAAGVPASVAYNRRSMPLVLELKRRIEQAGPVETMTLEMRRTMRAEPDFSATAIHCLDLARHLAQSDYKSAEIRYRVSRDKPPAADIAVLAEFESGALATLGFYPMCGVVSERVTVKAGSGVFMTELPVYGSVDGAGRLVCMRDNRVVDTVYGSAASEAEANGFLDQAAGFLDAVLAGRTPPHAIQDGIQAVELMCRVGARMKDFRKEGL